MSSPETVPVTPPSRRGVSIVRIAALTAVLVAVGGAVLFAVRYHGRESAYDSDWTRANSYITKGKYPEAALELRKAIQERPDSWMAHYYLSICADKLDNKQEQYDELRRTLDINPGLTPAKLDVAELLIGSNRAPEAKQYLDDAADASSKNPRYWQLYGHYYLAQNMPAKAIESFEKAKQVAPDDAKAWTLAGFAKATGGDRAGAEGDFKKAIQLDPAASDAYKDLATLYRVTSRPQLVEPLLRDAIQRNPQSLDLQFSLAEFYWNQHRSSDVDRLFADLKQRNNGQDPSDLAIAIGDFWTSHNDLPRANAEYQQAKPSGGMVAVVQKKLISNYISMGQVAEAEKLNGELLKKDPADVQGKEYAGALLYMKKDYAGAADALAAAQKDDPRSAFLNYYLGLAYMATGRRQEAKTALYQSVASAGSFPPAYFALAELALEDGDWRTAEDYAEKGLAQDSGQIDGYMLLARALVMKGDAPQADAVLAKASSVPGLPASYFELRADVAARRNDMKAANGYYDQALNATPDAIAVLADYSDFMAQHGQADAAIERVQSWRKHAPPDPEYDDLLARLYLAKGDLKAAEVSSRASIQADPNRWHSFIVLGDVLANGKKYTEAAAAYDSAQKLNPKAALPSLAAGEMWADQGEYGKARAYYEQAIRVAPDSLDARLGLARCSAELGGNLDVALSAAQDVSKNRPDDPKVADVLGWLYYRKGVYGLAMQQLKSAAKALPDDALVQYHYGMASLQTGRPQDGRQAIDHALRLGLPPATQAEAQQALKTSPRS